jgi:lipoprotein-releasing system permease protein
MALRYFRSAQGREEGRRFIRFITYVAVGGVALGTAALLLALSIVRGFSQEIESKIIGFGAHIQVETFQDTPLDDAGAIEADLSAMDGVVEVSPIVQEFALLRRSAQEIDGVAIWGTNRPPPYILDQIVEGRFYTGRDSSGLPGVVIGTSLAALLNVQVGDRVTAFSMRSGSGGAGVVLGAALPRIKQFYVTGTYETSLANFDEIYAFTAIEEARDLLGYEADEVTRFDLTLAHVKRADETVRRIEAAFGFPIMARTIYEVYSGLFAWVNLQEGIIPIVISVIVIVAAFNIIGTLLMMILEKTREIGILESMGASPKSLRTLFIWMGVLIGAVGTILGEALALGFGIVQARYGLIPLPEEAYYLETAPIELHALDFVLVGVATLILCVLAAYLPARVAARIEPIRAIQFR